MKLLFWNYNVVYWYIEYSQNTNQWANVCVWATARICFDLVSWQRLPLLTMQQSDFLFQVKRSPEWGQPQGHLKSWLIFDILLEYFIGNSWFESRCSIYCQPVLLVSCLDQSYLKECIKWMIDILVYWLIFHVYWFFEIWCIGISDPLVQDPTHEAKAKALAMLEAKAKATASQRLKAEAKAEAGASKKGFLTVRSQRRSQAFLKSGSRSRLSDAWEPASWSQSREIL